MSVELKNTILEALGSVLPEDAREKISESIDSYATELKESLESEYNSKLDESYKQFDAQMAAIKEQHEVELDEAEKVAENGYRQAAQLVEEARAEAAKTEEEAYQGYEEARQMMEEQEEKAYQGYEEARQMIEAVKSEYEEQAYKGYEEAYKIIKSLQEQNEQLEADLYEQYQKALSESREDLVDKIDEFITDRMDKIKDMITTEAVEDNEGATALLKQIMEMLQTHFAGEEVNADADVDGGIGADEELEKQLAAMESHIAQMQEENKRLEAKNFRLLAESARAKEEMNKLISESREVDETATRRAERQERRESARLVEGNGEVVNREEVVVEEVASEEAKGEKVEGARKSTEAMILAGIRPEGK